MLHKILLFNVPDADKVSVIRDKAFELLSAAGAHNVTFRSAINQGTVNYQYLITVEFKSMDDHEAYMVHEKHVQFSKEYFRPHIDENLLIQFFE